MMTQLIHYNLFKSYYFNFFADCVLHSMLLLCVGTLASVCASVIYANICEPPTYNTLNTNYT